MTPEEFALWKKSVIAHGPTYAMDARTNRVMANQVAAYSQKLAARIRALSEALEDMARMAKDLEED